MRGCPGLAHDTSQIPSLCPENSLMREDVIMGPLKLDTILLVWAFNLVAALRRCDDDW